MSSINHETVLGVRHWTDRLFSFRATRSPGFRFEGGQFAMIGIEVEGRPLLRAYSMCSAAYADELEFFSIKVANGPLTSRLAHLQAGDALLVGAKATGTLIPDNLLAGRNLFLLGTGTGVAPFASIVRAPETYERFERVVLVHGCREVAELGYSEQVFRQVSCDEIMSEVVQDRLLYYPATTREAFRHEGRITELLTTGRLTAELGLDALDASRDRVMLCGSPAMLTDLEMILHDRGFAGSTSNIQGSYAIERAFVDR